MSQLRAISLSVDQWGAVLNALRMAEDDRLEMAKYSPHERTELAWAADRLNLVTKAIETHLG